MNLWYGKIYWFDNIFDVINIDAIKIKDVVYSASDYAAHELLHQLYQFADIWCELVVMLEPLDKQVENCFSRFFDSVI